MNKIALLSVSAVGGLALFGVAFLGFAKLNGVPLHSLPGVGGMFPKVEEDHGDTHAAAPDAAGADHTASPTPAEDHGQAPHAGATDASAAETTTAGESHAPPPKPIHDLQPEEARASVFDLLDVDGLYTQEELKTLADSLRAKNREADNRLHAIESREEMLADRLTALDERRRTLDDFAKQLDARERELSAREAEARRDGQAAGADGAPADMSGFFGDGDTEVLAQRLAGFSPEEAGAILVKLAPERARELLDALPAARWRDFAEAYARLQGAQPPKGP